MDRLNVGEQCPAAAVPAARDQRGSEQDCDRNHLGNFPLSLGFGNCAI